MKLETRLEEIKAVISAKRDQLTAALTGGKDAGNLPAELAALEAEADVLPLAIKQQKARAEHDQANQDASEKAEVERRQELAQYARQAGGELATLAETLGKMEAILRTMRGFSGSPIGTGVIIAVREEMERLRRESPELLGLPQNPTPKELLKRELSAHMTGLEEQKSNSIARRREYPTSDEYEARIGQIDRAMQFDRERLEALK